MSSRRSLNREDFILRTLRLIHDNPKISQREIAAQVGVSVGAVHYCLKALAERGLIKLGNFQSSRNKRAYFYLLTSEGIAVKASLTIVFLKRKLAEYETLKSEIAVLESEVTGKMQTERNTP